MRQFIDACHDDASVARVSTRNPLARERSMWKTRMNRSLFVYAVAMSALSAGGEVQAKRESVVAHAAITVGREGEKVVVSTSAFAPISPDGKAAAFGYDDPQHPWFGLYSIQNNSFKMLDLPSSRVWIQPRWSPDSKTIVVASNGYDARTAMHDRTITQFDLIDIATGKARTLVVGPGLRNQPFFARDGKTVYYFEGQACITGCKTVGGRYDLFRVRLADRAEEQLTRRSFYEVSRGDESRNGGPILFAGITYAQQQGLYAYDVQKNKPELLHLPSEQIGNPRVDVQGQLNFDALAGRGRLKKYIYDKKGRWQYSVSAIDLKTQHHQKLFDLAWHRDRTFMRLSEFDVDDQGDILHYRKSDTTQRNPSAAETRRIKILAHINPFSH